MRSKSTILNVKERKEEKVQAVRHDRNLINKVNPKTLKLPAEDFGSKSVQILPKIIRE